jgi:hypothetical protein
VKKFVYIVIVAALPLALVACGGTAAASGNRSAFATVAPDTPLARPSQLAVALIKLEGTANAVTTSQAATLLPLWQAYASLLGSSTSAPAEYQGLQNQIEAAMTPDQLKAIDAMKLTQADLQTVFQGPGGGGFNPQGTPRARSNGSSGGGFAGGGGGFAGGGGEGRGGGGGGGIFVGPPGEFAGGGGGFFGPGGAQGTPSAAQQATLQARIKAEQAISEVAGVNARTVNFVVRFLEIKVYGTPTPAPTVTPTP